MLTIRDLTGRLRAAGTAVGLGLVAAACGGGSPGDGGSPFATACNPADPSTADACGTVLIALTDAEGDFTSYAVDVVSISLEPADGTTIETLPSATRIDFAALTEVADLLSATTLAPADIVGGRIRLDYTDAEIHVETADSIVPAEIVDSAGDPLGVVDVEIRLDAAERLVVTRGRTHLLQIDFDLAASHSVDTTAAPPVATAEPFLVAEVRPIDEKTLRVRGALVDVDTANATYEIRVRPWLARLGDHGAVTVHTDASTEFDIDGEVLTGVAGLEALSAEPAGTVTVAFGTLDVTDRRFTASIVETVDVADTMTAIHGNIVSRNGGELLVKGALAVPHDRRFGFHRTVVVTVGPNTGVTRRGDGAAAFDEGDLSVGQRIVALGTATNADAAEADPDTALVIDATAGRIRMLPTRLAGTVNSIVPGQINVTLRSIDRLGAGLFDFTGTGASPATDADPGDYEIATGALPLAAVETGRPIRVIGHVAAFGAAPPDFSGSTVIGPRDLRSALGIGWGTDGTAAPFQAMSAASLVADLTNPDIDIRHHMLIGPSLVDLLDLPASPPIEPALRRGRYGIAEPGLVELYGDFAEFVDELAIRLGGGERARALSALGSYDESTNALESRRVVVHLLPAD